MKTNSRGASALLVGAFLLLSCGAATAAFAAGEAAPTAAYAYDQRVFGPPEPLVSSARSQAVLARFQEAYARMGRPRFVIRVNPPAADAAPEEPTLADRQTRRDVERCFGRPLRLGGAALLDEGAGADDAAPRPDAGGTNSGGAAAEVVIEVLVSSRQIPFGTDGAVVTVPDIQATAVRLADRVVLGQAAASDLLGIGAAAGEKARHHTVDAIVEATALALLEDLANTVQPPS